MSSENYGSRFWWIIGDKKNIAIQADNIVVSPAGDLIALGGYRKEAGSPTPDTREQTLLILARGQWTCAYAASVINGDMVAVDQVIDHTKK